jgi:NADP-dependent 3-hydroxy acid dehydrogenase YdfG
MAYDTSPKPLQDLRGQVALVTGASSGIGQAIAEQLVERGTHVALFARRTSRLRALAERLAAGAKSPAVGSPGETLVITGDVREGEGVQHAVAATLERWGKLDILVANAGSGYRLSVVEGDPHRWKEMIDTNVYGLLLTLKYGVPPLLERGAGHVIVTSSIAGRVPTPGGAAYCGTKAAASAIADSLRQEVGPRGVRVTTLEPGVVISEFQQVAEYAPDILPAMLKGAMPLLPVDIARAVIFALELPAHVAVNELVVRPTGQTYP